MVTRRDPAASKLPWKGPRPRCPKKRFSSNQPKLRMPLWRTSWSHRYFLDGEAEGSKNSSRALLLAQQIERQRHGQGFSGEGERRAQGSTVGCFCDFKTATGLFAPLFRVQSIHRNLLTNAGLRVNNCDKIMCVGAHGILILPRAAGLSSLKLLPLNSFCPPPLSVWLCLSLDLGLADWDWEERWCQEIVLGVGLVSPSHLTAKAIVCCVLRVRWITSVVCWMYSCLYISQPASACH
jgi:hypothetical protein